jgi:GNAT superfamily N-acetyltransferase
MSSTAPVGPALARGGVRVEPVTDARGLRAFIEFPFALYRTSRVWVPPFIEERRAFFDQRKNPFFEHARAQLFLARRAGEVVGTVAACVDDAHNRFHSDRQGAFGFFETIDDPQVAGALLEAAETWVRGQQMAVIRGPLNFSINHEYGLLVDGFAEPPMIMTTYNPPYYAALIEAAGYRTAMNLFAYIGDLDERWQNAPPKVFRVAEKVLRKEGIRVRKVNMRRFEDDVRRVRQVYDQAWSQLWDFVPVTEREAAQVAQQLKLILDPDLAFIAETAEGEPIGVSVTLPDLNQALLKSGGGRMLPLGLPRFLWHRRSIDQARLWAMGVVDAYRGRGVDAVFYVETARAALAKGYRRLEGSLILENNLMMNRIIERLGGQRYKTYRLYEKALDNA